MFPVAPDEVMPAVEPMIRPPPELRLKVPVLPSSVEVPMLTVAPLRTAKFTAVAAIDPLVLENVWVPLFLKLNVGPATKLPLVMEPPLIVRSPSKLKVGLIPEFAEPLRIPAVTTRFPLILTLAKLVAAPLPDVVTVPPVFVRFTTRFPLIVIVLVWEAARFIILNWLVPAVFKIVRLPPMTTPSNQLKP